MFSTRSFLAFAAAAWLVGVLSACGGKGLAEAYSTRDYDHEYTLAPGDEFHPGMKTAIVLPMNALIERPNGLEVADETLVELITAELEARGVAVDHVNPAEYSRAQGLAVRTARERMLSGTSGRVSTEIDPEQFVAALLPALEQSADLVIAPSVVVRTGTYSGRYARWDGVRRRERVRGVAYGGVYGTPNGASLLAMVYAADGRQLFRGYGGLDLIYTVDLTTRQYELREDLLEDQENLAEGVCISFHPFFGSEAC